MRFASLLVVFSVAAACGGSSATGVDSGVTGGPDAPLPPDAPAPPPDAAPAVDAPPFPAQHVADRSVARLAVGPERVVLLEETLAGFTAPMAPGPRRLRSIDRATLAETIWAPAASPATIADVALHPDGSLTAAVVAVDNTISLVRLGPALDVRATLTVVDADAVNDPLPIPGGDPEFHASGASGNSVRLAPAGDDVVLAVLTSRNSVVAARFGVDGETWARRWRTLVEPATGLTPFLPIGGSFDTFEAIVDWYRPALATDASGDAYIAVWGGQSRIHSHVMVFDDGLVPLPSDPGERDADVLVTRLEPSGARAWTRVVGTKYEDEPYGIAASEAGAVVVGRSRRNPGHDNSQWDPWLAALAPDGSTRISRTFVFDALGLFEAVAIDDAGAIVAGGSDGWIQNPEGLSIGQFGVKLLVTLAAADAAPVRIPLPAGPRHNEIRDVRLLPGELWYAGHEDGPLTHSGDADPTQIRANGVAGVLLR